MKRHPVFLFISSLGSLILAVLITAVTSFAADSTRTRYEGVVIDSILIDNRNIYNTSDDEYNNFIFRTANKLHYRTRKTVIQRELLFQVGDTLSGKLLEETERNLRHRLLVFDARVSPRITEDGELLVEVTTIDQWSLAGGLQFARDGNETKYRFWSEEKNFLGRNVLLASEYTIWEAESNYFGGRFLEDRFLGRPYRLSAGYSGNPLGSFTSFGFSRPFYNRSQRFGFAMAITATGGRNDKYRDDIRIASFRNEGDLSMLSAEYRWGSYLRKLHLIGRHIYRFGRVTDKRIYSPNPADSLAALESFPNDSTFHEEYAALRFTQINFLKTRRVDGYGYVEDINLGQAIQLGFGRSFSPKYRSTLYDVAELSLSQGHYFDGHLFFLSYDYRVWYKDGFDLRRLARLTLKYYNNILPFLTIASRSEYFSDWRRDGNDELTLGGTSGLRGYDKFFRTGDRLARASIEGRFLTGIRFMSISLAAVVFADGGRVWRSGEDLRLKNFYRSVGIGLRLHFERTSRGRIMRIDLARAGEFGWELSIGTGQYFGASAGSLLLTN